MRLAALTLCTKHAVRMYTPRHAPSCARRVVKSVLSALSLSTIDRAQSVPNARASARALSE
jgi:hypothetical protein